MSTKQTKGSEHEISKKKTTVLSSHPDARAVRKPSFCPGDIVLLSRGHSNTASLAAGNKQDWGIRIAFRVGDDKHPQNYRKLYGVQLSRKFLLLQCTVTELKYTNTGTFIKFTTSSGAQRRALDKEVSVSIPGRANFGNDLN